MKDTTSDPDIAAKEGAARWDARMRSPDCSERDRAAFRAWIEADPRHAEAYDQLRQSVSALRSAAHLPEIQALRDAALNRRSPAPQRLAAIAAALLLAAIAVPIGLSQMDRSGPAPVVAGQQEPTGYYATAIGQRADITLEDGSIVTLNTDSRIHVRYDEQERLITLLKGQALFEVAHETERRFIVAAGDQRVIALGTTFDVRLFETGVEVILVEGKVEITEVPGPSQKRTTARLVQLESGERLMASAATEPVVTRIDTGKATSWREGVLSFDDTPLTDAVAEMNRYSTIRIITEDAELAGYRVNGVFRSGQQARFVEALEAYFPLEVERRGDTIVLKISHPT